MAADLGFSLADMESIARKLQIKLNQGAEEEKLSAEEWVILQRLLIAGAQGLGMTTASMIIDEFHPEVISGDVLQTFGSIR